MKKNKKEIHEDARMEGRFRLQITQDENGVPKVIGDSGWCKNQIVDLGVQDYIIDWLVAGTDSAGKSITHLALGTGGAPASNDTSLSGEVVKRQAVTTSIVASRTAQFTGAFASSNSFVTDTRNISNVALFNTSSGGTLFAGNTYASSSCATNQNVNVTYQIRFPNS